MRKKKKPPVIRYIKMKNLIGSGYEQAMKLTLNDYAKRNKNCVDPLHHSNVINAHTEYYGLVRYPDKGCIIESVRMPMYKNAYQIGSYHTVVDTPLSSFRRNFSLEFWLDDSRIYTNGALAYILEIIKNSGYTANKKLTFNSKNPILMTGSNGDIFENVRIGRKRFPNFNSLVVRYILGFQ